MYGIENLTKEQENELKTKVENTFAGKYNHTLHAYVDITGDLIEGTLLSQILYWFNPDKNGNLKVRILKDGYYWIAKQRKDWQDEIRITERQYDRAIKSLKDKGFVILSKYKFNSMPTIHIRPDYDNINKAVDKWKENVAKEIVESEPEVFQWCLPKVSNGNNTKCNSNGNDTKCKTGITKSSNLLTENTNRDYITDNTISEITDKYAFPPKEEKENGNIYASFSEEKEEPIRRKESRYIPEDYTEQQLIEHIKPVIDNRMAKEYPEIDNPTVSYTIMLIIVKFYREYEDRFHKKHRIMSDKAYENIVDRYMLPPDVMSDRDCNDFNTYLALIEKYFEVDYNKQGNYMWDIEPSISHFMSDNIRSHLFYQTCY